MNAIRPLYKTSLAALIECFLGNLPVRLPQQNDQVGCPPLVTTGFLLLPAFSTSFCRLPLQPFPLAGWAMPCSYAFFPPFRQLVLLLPFSSLLSLYSGVGWARHLPATTHLLWLISFKGPLHQALGISFNLNHFPKAASLSFPALVAVKAIFSQFHLSSNGWSSH